MIFKKTNLVIMFQTTFYTAKILQSQLRFGVLHQWFKTKQFDTLLLNIV